MNELQSNELRVVTKLAKSKKLWWFKFCRSNNGDFAVYDLENHATISLDTGIDFLRCIGGDWQKHLNKSERATFKKLLFKLGIERGCESE